MKALIDVNVLVDAVAGRKPFDQIAGQIMLAIERNYVEGVILTNSLEKLHYVMRKIHGKQEARKVIEGTLRIFKVLDVTEMDCRLALLSGRADFEDAVLMESARRNGVEYIVTRNEKDFSDSPVPVISPEEFLKIV